MKRAMLLGSVCAAIVGASLVFSPTGARAQNLPGTADDDGRHHPPPVYNPYPPGILPPDLDSEIARVRREVQFIFEEALAEWGALTPPTLTGNPPTLQGTGYQAV